jgi:hypothetical protein
MKKIVLNVSLLASIVLAVSCGESTKTADEATNVSAEMTTGEDTLQDEVVYNVPSPGETFSLLKGSGVPFDKSLLNPAGNISKYVTNFSKAVNLGVYSADLSISLLYEQKQETSIYLKNISELTAALNIDGNFIQSVAKRAASNSDKLDSLNKIVSEVSINSKLFLNDNKMNNTTALMTVGGWIESMYFITSTAEKSKKKELINLVTDQKFSVKNLISELEKFKSDKEIENLLVDLKGIAAIYDALKEAPATAAKTPEEKGVVSIGGNISLELSNEQLKSILEKTIALRNKIVL